MTSSPTLATEVGGALLAAAGSFVALWIGHRRGFFNTPYGLQKPFAVPTLLWVILAFALYFLGGIITPTLLRNSFSVSPLAHLAWITFLASSVILVALVILLFVLPERMRLSIWQRRPNADLKNDALLAFSAWLISFPIVLLIGTALEILLYLIYHTFHFPDQLAIVFLKMTFNQPFYLLLATLSIVVLAPLIEEFLFRGFLQSYLRRYCNPSIAILLSSFCFTLFHYSGEQGMGNLPILSSLFALGCFLGFLYERQGSLLSPLILHATFNALSVGNLYFLGES